jgi:hypothetical protein
MRELFTELRLTEGPVGYDEIVRHERAAKARS